jgi:hypothetical protein
MQSALVKISLLPTDADLRVVGGSLLQFGFDRFRQFLHARGIPAATPMFYRDKDAAAGGYAGDFVMPLISAVRPPLRAVMAAWLDGRAGRAVKLRIADEELRTHSVKQAMPFLRRAVELRQAPWQEAS